MTADGYTSNPPSGGEGGGGSVAWADITGKPSTFTPAAHTQAASTISDSTATGRAVLTAADAAAARTAIGAGTSSLALGATGSTAAAGNHSHAVADVATLQTLLDEKAPLASPALTGNPTAPTQTAGNDSTRLATTAFVTAAVAAGGGGGGGTPPTFSRAHVTSGNVAISADASWTPVTGLTIAIAAAEGDNLHLAVAGLISHTDSSFYELAVLVGGSPVRYASTGTSSPAGGGEGDPSMYPLAGGALHPFSTFMDFEVASEDLFGGNVTFALMHLGSGGGQVYASTTFPFRWRVRNDH